MIGNRQLLFVVLSLMILGAGALAVSTAWFAPAAAEVTGASSSTAPSSADSHKDAKKYRVVFEITDPAGINDPAGQGYAKWKTVLNNVNNSLNEIGEDNMQVEVVVHSDAIPLLNKNESPQELQAIIKKLQDRGVVFAACANAMKSRGYTMDDMLPGVVQVPAGVAEVIRKQQEGWIYMHP